MNMPFKILAILNVATKILIRKTIKFIYNI